MAWGARARRRAARGSEDPYRHVDLTTATRLGGVISVVGLVFAAVVLALSPDRGPLGLPGVLGYVAVCLGWGAFLLLRRRPAHPDVLYAGTFLSIASITLYRASAGPDAALEQLLFGIAIYACAIHPVRRAVTALGVASAATLTPALYEQVGLHFAIATLNQLLLTWCVGLIVLAWMVRVRRGRAEAAAAKQRADELARVDALTGLGNRRALEEALPVAVATARRQGPGGVVSVLVADLDGFKGINDEHGHQAGDDMLRSAARALTAAVRLSDPTFRYGGDEFVALLPDARLEEAQEIARRIESTVALSCRTPDGRPLRVSVGAAELGPADTGEDTFARADAALLEAKAWRRRARASA